MTLPRYDKKRRLERAGFAFISGWVRKESAPKLQKVIDREQPEALASLEKTPATNDRDGE
jgi:hypothetical protein